MGSFHLKESAELARFSLISSDQSVKMREDLQSRISLVLEDLARAAVLEIREVLEEVLQLEISQSRRENELLKRKIVLLEKRLKLTRAGRCRYSLTAVSADLALYYQIIISQFYNSTL